jgi:phosphatidylinositol glycan class B
MTRRAWIALLAVLGGALIVRVAVALALPSAVWPDEIFQTQEQAHRLAFGDGLVPWEFRVGARSWLLPGVLGALFRATGRSYLVAETLALAVVSLIPVAACFRAVAERGDRVVPAAPRRLTGAGALVGLALGLRIHLAPAVVMLAVLAFVRARRRAVSFVGAIVVVLLALGVLDWITWGAPFASYATTIRTNLIQGVAQRYGVAPWWAYFAAIAGAWRAAGLIVVALALVGARRDPWPLAIALVVLASHAAIDHKEYRFAVPAIALVVYAAGLGAGELAARVRWPVAAGASLAWCAMSWWLAASLSTRTTTLGIALAPPTWQFASQRGGLVAMRRAGQLEPLCGVGLVGIPWFLTGGYTWLDRSVPLEELHAPAELASETGALDALLAPASIALPAPYVRAGCDAGICVWHRPGACTKPAHDLRDFAPP